MINIFSKSVLIISMLGCMVLLLASKSLLIVALAGLLFIITALLLNEMTIKDTKKVEFEGEEVYLSAQKLDEGLYRKNFCRITEGIKPAIIMSQNMFNAIEDGQKRAIYLTKRYLVEHGYTLKKTLFLVIDVVLMFLARYIPSNNKVAVYVALFAFIVYLIACFLYHRKQFYDADAFAVRKMKDSKPLVDFLESCLEEDAKITLRLEPSVKARINRIKANLN